MAECEVFLTECSKRIIRAPEFQRLKNIKQVSGAEYVLANATHTRYEHSIGTAHLARMLVEQLRDSQKGKKEYSNARVDEFDIRCVEIAALCHDLGHGPFSFVLIKYILPRLKINEWENKELSYKIFAKIWEGIVERDSSMKEKLRDPDMIFIKEIIEGTTKFQNARRYRGRPEPKWFLYEIMSNQNSPVDVCKWDYLLRDRFHLGVRDDLPDQEKAMRELHLISRDSERYHINSPSNFMKDESDLMLYKMHKYIYQSSKMNSVRHMICDAVVSSNHKLNFSRRVCDLDSFCKMDDTILEEIKALMPEDEDDKLLSAQMLIKRLKTFDHYTPVTGVYFREHERDRPKDEAEIIQKLGKRDPSLALDSIKVSIIDERVRQFEMPLLTTGLMEAQVFCVDSSVKEKVKDACTHMFPLKPDENT